MEQRTVGNLLLVVVLNIMITNLDLSSPSWEEMSERVEFWPQIARLIACIIIQDHLSRSIIQNIQGSYIIVACMKQQGLFNVGILSMGMESISFFSSCWTRHASSFSLSASM
jgi:hypothetical protein